MQQYFPDLHLLPHFGELVLDTTKYTYFPENCGEHEYYCLAKRRICVRIRNISQSGRQQNLEEIIMFSSPLVVQILLSMQRRQLLSA